MHLIGLYDAELTELTLLRVRATKEEIAQVVVRAVEVFMAAYRPPGHQ